VSSTGETRKNQSIGAMAVNSGFLEGRQNQKAAAMASADKLRKAGEAQKSARNKERLGIVFADAREKMLSPAQRVQRVQRELAHRCPLHARKRAQLSVQATTAVMRASQRPPAQPGAQWIETTAKTAEPPDGLERLQAYDDKQFAAIGALRILELEELEALDQPEEPGEWQEPGEQQEPGELEGRQEPGER
jgi:hypothetical protein